MKVFFSRTSLRYLQGLERNVSRKIVDSIEKLSLEGDTRKMKGKKIKNIYRLRIGRYRVIYSLYREIIKIIKIDTRGDVYKK